MGREGMGEGACTGFGAGYGAWDAALALMPSPWCEDGVCAWCWLHDCGGMGGEGREGRERGGEER